ncbi:polygalacturonase ADPG1-like [Canna indica]|uniref:Polygalacturonase ADPG1-like n=1 Tax=Canna indica TaxID=4628 RepID=A0AAQ3KZC1_9LILI|nr:polygalacturonase ADPG1-like [Canna indica]
MRKSKVFGVVFFLTISFAIGGYAATYNVLDYGAKGTGNTDDSKAFLNAWGAACGDSNYPTFFIPGGMTFYLSQTTFNGPCKSAIHVMIDGTLIAPNNVWTGDLNHWLAFRYLEGLTIDGKGEINGQGQVWWNCKHNKSLYLQNCRNLRLSGLTFKDSPKKHITVEGGNGGQVNGITIIAPEDSPNTDGIYLRNSQYFTISNSFIGTGDDCISVGPGSSYVNITGITCGPGHGISIGSLGTGNSEVAVEQIYVYNCTIMHTQNGVRIKTWQGGSGYARGITFSKIKLENVQNPIIIDQYYCNGEHNCQNQTSAVQVSDVYYTQVMGTTTSKVGINFRCSQTVPCTGIALEDVNIQSSESGQEEAFCFDAQGKSNRVVPVPSMGYTQRSLPNVPSFSLNLSDSKEPQVDGASPSTLAPSHVSNIPSSSSVVGPKEPNYTRKVFLQPQGDDGFDDAYESWTKIPEATRRIWFREWKKHVYWEPMHEDHMWHAFNKKGSSHLSVMYCALRKSNKRPHWIGTEIWEGLRQIWSTEKHKQKSE